MHGKIMETFWLDLLRVRASHLAGKARPLEITAQKGNAPHRTISGPSMKLLLNMGMLLMWGACWWAMLRK